MIVSGGRVTKFRIRDPDICQEKTTALTRHQIWVRAGLAVSIIEASRFAGVLEIILADEPTQIMEMAEGVRSLPL